MKNITLAIPDDLLAQARRRAAEKGTTINAFVRESLRQFVSVEDERALARRELVEMAKSSSARMGSDFKWDREEIYAERLFPRHEYRGVRSDGED
ncbi:MAG: hypothetical protein ACXWVJ_06865 [Caulobacteraceae bacterium]